jgi:GT2 family glycosyltransferase
MLSNHKGSNTEISAVVVNFNSAGSVLRAIESLAAQGLPPEAILVVDDHSQDGSPQQIRKAFPAVRLVELERNMGLSYARNQGLNQTASEFVLFVDDDIYMADNALQGLLQAQRETGATVVVPRIVIHPEDRLIQCDGARIHMTGTLRLRHADQPIEACPAEQSLLPAFIGACLLVHRPSLTAADGFDEDYFFYFEDLELSYRLSALGHKIVCAAQALAYHDRGQGTPKLSYRGSGVYPKRRAYYVIRHRWLTIWLHYQPKTLLILSPMLAVYELALFAVTLGRGWLIQWLRALFWLVKNAPKIFIRRQHWQNLRKIPDREILTGGSSPFATGFVQTGAAQLAVRMLEFVMNRYWLLARRWL